jgi:hypothetical protein
MTPIWTALTVIVAVVALGLSVWNFSMAARARRRAEIHIAFRSFVQGKQTQTWFVISNRGQATGKNVCVSFDLAGEEWAPQWYAFPIRFPIRMIASGDSVQVRVNVSREDHSKGEGMAFGRISWRDHGRRPREYETTVSLSAVPFGGGITTESVMSDIAALGAV